MSYCPILILSRTSFFTSRERTWALGWGLPLAISLLIVIEYCNKDQNIACDGSIPMRVFLFRSTVDLSGLVKLKKYRFPGR